MSNIYPNNDQPTYVPPQPTPQKKPWYKTNGGIILLLILFFPAGLLLMWSYAKWPKNAKWIVTAIIGVIAVISLATSNHNTPSATTPTPTQQVQAAAPTVATTPVATAIPKPTPTPTTKPTPKPAPTWQTTHTYTGNGAKKTETIAVPGDWKLLWKCDPTSSFSGSYNVIVDVDNSDGTPADPAAINTICSSTNTSGDTEERQSGNVYFDVNSEAAWTLTIQELK